MKSLNTPLGAATDSIWRRRTPRALMVGALLVGASVTTVAFAGPAGASSDPGVSPIVCLANTPCNSVGGTTTATHTKKDEQAARKEIKEAIKAAKQYERSTKKSNKQCEIAIKKAIKQARRTHKKLTKLFAQLIFQ